MIIETSVTGKKSIIKLPKTSKIKKTTKIPPYNVKSLSLFHAYIVKVLTVIKVKTKATITFEVFFVFIIARETRYPIPKVNMVNKT